MKIDFNPNAAAHAPKAHGPQAQSTPTPPAPEGSDGGVEITLSPAATQALKAGASEYTGNSPAHMARQYIANNLAAASAEGGDGPDLSGPFGQIVKTFAPGHNKTTAEPEGTETPPADGTEGTDGTGEIAEGDPDTGVVETPEETGGTGETGETGDGTVVAGPDETDDTTVVEGPDETDPTIVAGGPDETVGTDPVIVVEEPDVTEVLDDTTPVDGEVGEPESGLAGSGDAVASTGDGESGDGTTPVAPSEPVEVVDGGDLTDELLDLLDEGSAETV